MRLPFSDTQQPICFSCWGVVKHSFIHSCAMGRRIDPSWGGPIELFLIQASAP